MSRLEEKLLELGYELNPFIQCLYYKPIHNYIDIHIYVRDNEITSYGVNRTFLISHRKEITFINEAYNIMWKDLEELKKYETNE